MGLSTYYLCCGQDTRGIKTGGRHNSAAETLKESNLSPCLKRALIIRDIRSESPPPSQQPPVADHALIQGSTEETTVGIRYQRPGYLRVNQRTSGLSSRARWCW